MVLCRFWEIFGLNKKGKSFFWGSSSGVFGGFFGDVLFAFFFLGGGCWSLEVSCGVFGQMTTPQNTSALCFQAGTYLKLTWFRHEDFGTSRATGH